MMTVSAKTLRLDSLTLNDRLALVEEIWASICADPESFSLTDAQRSELDRRVMEDEAFPDDVTSWKEIKAAMQARLSQ